MSQPKHIALLKELANVGIGYSFNVTEFLLLNFPKAQESGIWKWEGKEGRAASLFLMDMFDRKLIAFDLNDNQEFQEQGYTYLAHWYYDKLDLIYITSKGLDYLDKYNISQINFKLNNSYVDVNKASKKSYRNQFILGFITIVLAGTSSYISWLTYAKTDTTASSVDSLRLEIRKWRTQKMQTPIPLTLSPRHPRIPEPSVLNR